MPAFSSFYKYTLSKFTLGVALSATIALSACYPATTAYRDETAVRLARPVFMHERKIDTGDYILTAYERVRDEGKTADLYIEGDGMMFEGNNVPFASGKIVSDDPTPVNPVALHLASYDKGRNVIYLARPCQYTDSTTNKNCSDPAAWTTQRYSKENIDAMNTALNDIKNRYDLKGFNLVGYDGGAAVAVILAAKRKDILSLRTVGGFLDTDRIKGQDPTLWPADGPNPVNYALEIAKIPQHHFIGALDPIVSSYVYENYYKASGPDKCLRFSIVDNAGHTKGWVNIWPDLLQMPVDCVATEQPGTITTEEVTKTERK